MDSDTNHQKFKSVIVCLAIRDSLFRDIRFSNNDPVKPNSLFFFNNYEYPQCY